MHTKALLTTFLLSTIVVATPMPDKNLPISDAEWAALKNSGLQGRKVQNVPISVEEMTRLKANGLTQRDGGLEARDKVLNCGKDITGKKGIGGAHVGWVPRAQFEQVAKQFCNAYVGTDISENHQTSDTYPVTLTNQDNISQTGPQGNVVFAIYNTARKPTYFVDSDTCFRAMQAPLLAYVNAGHSKGDGDRCYGSKNKDYEGGYEFIEGIGAFGSEVTPA